MNFLQRFTRAFAAFFRRSQTVAISIAVGDSHVNTGPVAADLPIARFLTKSKDFGGTRVKKGAFMPDPDEGMTTSVYVVDTLELSQIRDLGEINKVAPLGRTLYGYGGLDVATVLKHGPRVLRSEPPPRHADITNWPADKDEQIQIALELAAVATLNVFAGLPSSGTTA